MHGGNSTIMKTVADIIDAPPSTDSYQQIKDALINRLVTSEETQLRPLLTSIELKEKKPSELLSEMMFLADTNVSKGVLQAL